jgi:hypothetical protein
MFVDYGWEACETALPSVLLWRGLYTLRSHIHESSHRGIGSTICCAELPLHPPLHVLQHFLAHSQDINPLSTLHLSVAFSFHSRCSVLRINLCDYRYESKA